MKNKLVCLGIMVFFLIVNGGYIFAQSSPSYTYNISTHTFSSSEGWSVSSGVYAGGGSVAKGDVFNASHQNNPNSSGITYFGPLPAGRYTIIDYHHTITDNTIILRPEFSTHRTLLRIHGDSIPNPGRASRGCIILGPNERQRIVNAFNTYGNLPLTVTNGSSGSSSSSSSNNSSSGSSWLGSTEEQRKQNAENIGKIFGAIINAFR